MITSINHLSFTVSNLDKSVKFYRDVLGIKVLDISPRDEKFSEKVTGIQKARLRIAYLEGKNCSVELVQYLSPRGKKIDTATCNIGSAHICFNLKNFGEFMGRMKKNKVRMAGEPQMIPAGPNKGRLVVYAKDPDSNNLEFISEEFYGR